MPGAPYIGAIFQKFGESQPNSVRSGLTHTRVVRLQAAELAISCVLRAITSKSFLPRTAASTHLPAQRYT